MSKSMYFTSAEEDGVDQSVETLNPRSHFKFDEVLAHVPHDVETVTLQWSLNSRRHQAEGELTLHVKTN